MQRHGDAGPRRTDPAEERYRCLTPEGMEGIRAIAREMLRRDQVPTVIYASNLTRTAETADAMGRILGCPVNLIDELAPHVPLEMFLEELIYDEDAKRVMIVGHQDNIDPWLEENAVNKDEGDPIDFGEVRKLRVSRADCSFEESWRILPEDVYDPDADEQDDDDDDPRPRADA